MIAISTVNIKLSLLVTLNLLLAVLSGGAKDGTRWCGSTMTRESLLTNMAVWCNVLSDRLLLVISAMDSKQSTIGYNWETCVIVMGLCPCKNLI